MAQTAKRRAKYWVERFKEVVGQIASCRGDEELSMTMADIRSIMLHLRSSDKFLLGCWLVDTGFHDSYSPDLF